MAERNLDKEVRDARDAIVSAVGEAEEAGPWLMVTIQLVNARTGEPLALSLLRPPADLNLVKAEAVDQALSDFGPQGFLLKSLATSELDGLLIIKKPVEEAPADEQ